MRAAQSTLRPVDELVFGGSAPERRRLGLYILGVPVPAPAVALGLALPHGPVATVLALGGVLAAVLGVLIYNGGSTTAGAEGIQVRRFPLPPVMVRWEDVASIDVLAATTSYGTIRTVRLTTGGGQTFRLRPLEDGARKQDPDIDKKCGQIVEFWERYA
jgi:hypothetical protein